MPPPIVFTVPVLVDSKINLENSGVLIPDGLLAKIAGSNQFKVGTGDKTWSQLEYIADISTASSSSNGLLSSADKEKLDSIQTGAQVNPGPATSTTPGIMSADDKKKLDGIAAGAQVNPTNISGNAGTATKLQTARTISLTGPVSGSTTFDGSGNVSIATSIDFSNMPTDKFEAMLKSIWVPIKLTANKNFYVATNGSDVLSSGRGESASLPFKTLQACVNYICDNYNLSNYNITINIASGTYQENSTINFKTYNTTSGSIVIKPTGTYKTVIFTNSIWRFDCNSKYTIQGIYIKYTPTLTQSSNLDAKIVIIQSGAFVTFEGCKFEVNLSNISGTGNINAGALIYVTENSNAVLNWSTTINEIIANKTNKLSGYVAFYVLYADGGIIQILTSTSSTSANAKINVSNSIFDTFAVAANKGAIKVNSRVNVPSITFQTSGTITGKKFACQSGGTMSVASLGLNYFPGSTAGTVDESTYSWYK